MSDAAVADREDDRTFNLMVAIIASQAPGALAVPHNTATSAVNLAAACREATRAYYRRLREEAIRDGLQDPAKEAAARDDPKEPQQP